MAVAKRQRKEKARENGGGGWKKEIADRNENFR